MKRYVPGGKIECDFIPQAFPAQHQPFQPGVESIMLPLPISDNPNYVGSHKLQGKVAIITGGDSGIGRAVAVAYAKEGADVAIVYLKEYETGDARETQRLVNERGQNCLLIQADVRQENACRMAVKQTIDEFGRLDILVNNAGASYNQKSIEDITSYQLQDIFQTNVFSCFYMVKAALPYMKRGSAIITCVSVTAYEGYEGGIDYSASKGALVSYTVSLAKLLVKRGIRVNAVAPGMTWTPLVPANLSAEETAYFGRDRPMGRAAQPYEMAPSFVFLASEADSSYMTGQVIVVT